MARYRCSGTSELDFDLAKHPHLGPGAAVCFNIALKLRVRVGSWTPSSLRVEDSLFRSQMNFCLCVYQCFLRAGTKTYQYLFSLFCNILCNLQIKVPCKYIVVLSVVLVINPEIIKCVLDRIRAAQRYIAGYKLSLTATTNFLLTLSVKPGRERSWGECDLGLIKGG